MTTATAPDDLARILEMDHPADKYIQEAATLIRRLPADGQMALAMTRALVEDRMEQLTVQPVPSLRDSGSDIEVSPLWQRIEVDLHEVAARTAGGEVVAFGMRELVNGLQDTIRERVIEWAVAYALGNLPKDATEYRAYMAAQDAASRG